jgi:hypothetical protein
MTVAKVVSSSYGNLGRGGTRKDSELVAIDGIILTTPDFTATIANLALEATWTDGIKAKTVFPLEGLDNYDDQSQEDTIYESPLRNRKLTKRGQRRYRFLYDIPFEVHRTLMTYYNNADLTVWLLRDGKIYFYNDGGTAKGFSNSMLNIGKLGEVPADGSTPALTPVYIDLENYRELDMYGEKIEPSWNVYDLQPLVTVTLEVVGTPTASSVVVRVYSQDGYDADGAVNKVGIKGIDEDDWTITFGTATSYTDNADGTYTWASSAAFSTGAASLKTPANMTNSTFVDLRIEGAGSVAVTIA